MPRPHFATVHARCLSALNIHPYLLLHEVARTIGDQRHCPILELTMPVVVPRTPASAMSASSHSSKPLLSSHEQRNKSSNSLSPTSALSSSSSHPHYHKPDNNKTNHTTHPTTTTRRALHYNTPQSAVSPRSTSTSHTSTTTPLTASTATTAATTSSDLLDLDSWQCDTETALERLIINAELVLSQEKQRARIGLHSGTAATADSFEQLDDKDQRELRDLIAQARKLEHGVCKELDDIQRSVAEEKEEVGTAKEGSSTAFTVQSSALQRVREMSEYIALLEAKVDDLQAEIDQHKPMLALSTLDKQAKHQLKQQLDHERQRYEQLQDQLHHFQTQHRNEQQLTAQLVQRLDDVSGSYDGSEAMLAEEKERGVRWLREKEEVKADKRRLEQQLQQSIDRETVVKHECDRRLVLYDSVRRDSVRVKMMGVLGVGLVVLWAGMERWLTEYVRSQPQLYTF